MEMFEISCIAATSVSEHDMIGPLRTKIKSIGALLPRVWPEILPVVAEFARIQATGILLLFSVLQRNSLPT